MTLRVMSFYERQRERIATPVCALARNDMEIWCPFYLNDLPVNETERAINNRLYGFYR